MITFGAEEGNILFMVDTGADVTVLDEAEAPTGRVLTAADGGLLSVLGKKRIQLTLAWGQNEEGVVYVLKGAWHNLLGKPEIREFGLVQSVCLVKEDVES